MPEFSALPVQLMLLLALALATWIVTETLREGALKLRLDPVGITLIIWCRDQAPFMEWAVRRLRALFDRRGIARMHLLLVPMESRDDTEDVAEQLAETWEGVSVATGDAIETQLPALLLTARFTLSWAPRCPDDWDRLLKMVSILLEHRAIHIRPDEDRSSC